MFRDPDFWTRRAGEIVHLDGRHIATADRHAILPRMRPRIAVSSLVLILALTVFPLGLPLNARVVRVEIASSTDVLNGKQFGDVGAYERITGRVYFSLPVANPHNQRIVDLRNAVNLKNGEVEC